jgi:hypothetical protein
LSGHRIELENRKDDLGKHLVSKDAKVRERFSIWVTGSFDKEKLLIVEVLGCDIYEVSWRN